MPGMNFNLPLYPINIKHSKVISNECFINQVTMIYLYWNIEVDSGIKLQVVYNRTQATTSKNSF